MIRLPEDRRPLISPQLALRIAILGGLALALFAIVFFRLWYLEVLSGEKYLAEANDNRVRDVRVQAPRGDIVDRHGRVLVDSRVAIAVQIEPQKLPEEGERRDALYRRLGRVLKMPARRIEREVDRQQAKLPYSNVTVKNDVPRPVFTYIFEHQAQFPSVTVQRIYLRRYPFRSVGAQLFGQVGEVTADQLKGDEFKSVTQGTIVGQDGIERTYDRYLRGEDGATRVNVDALGRPKGEGRVKQPVQGEQLRLSIDLDLEKVGMEALEEYDAGRGGAFAAIDPRNGQVLALGSYPSFDPNIFSRPLTQKDVNRLYRADPAPIVNRAITGAYPTGSTFKLVTAVAALQGGVLTPDTVISDGGVYTACGPAFQNDGGVAHGPVALRQALTVSSDVFFYTLGHQMNGVDPDLFPEAVRRQGIGRKTGIDLPGETDGLVPDRQWTNELFREKIGDHPWSCGDAINLSIGQGALQASPLQMAVAYSSVANGGDVVKPHVAMEVEDAGGRPVQKVDPGPTRKLDIPEGGRQAILDGLRGAASAPGGTSAPVFQDFPRPVHGKTGTAERPPNGNQSWYVAYVPDARRPIVVALTVEGGGYGAEAAAPAVKMMLAQWFGVSGKTDAPSGGQVSTD